MASTATFAEVAAVVGDPARAAMLHALMDGRALTASELARVGGITPQTASGHLARMTDLGLVAVARQGRHRYHRLASAAVAQMMESIMQVASLVEPPRRHLSVGPRDAALRQARTCYDHLAGRLGVALADALVRAGHAELSGEAGLITDQGLSFFDRLGIAVATAPARHGAQDTARGGGRRTARLLCRPCLDWSERRPHLAGTVGAALCAHCFSAGWVVRIAGTRAVRVTPAGARTFREAFDARLDEDAEPQYY